MTVLKKENKKFNLIMCNYDEPASLDFQARKKRILNQYVKILLQSPMLFTLVNDQKGLD